MTQFCPDPPMCEISHFFFFEWELPYGILKGYNYDAKYASFDVAQQHVFYLNLRMHFKEQYATSKSVIHFLL